MLLLLILLAQPQSQPAAPATVADDARTQAELKRQQDERILREKAQFRDETDAYALHRQQVEAAWRQALPVIQAGGPEGAEALRLLRAKYDNHALGNPLAAEMAAAGNPEERALGVMEGMAALIDEEKNDCDRMGERLNTFMDAHQQTIRDIKAHSDGQTEAQKKAIEEKYKARAIAAGEKMMGGIMKCMTNERVKAAMQKMKF